MNSYWMSRVIVVFVIIVVVVGIGSSYLVGYRDGSRTYDTTQTAYTVADTSIVMHINMESPVSKTIPANSKVMVLRKNDDGTYLVAYYPSQKAMFGTVNGDAIVVEK